MTFRPPVAALGAALSLAFVQPVLAQEAGDDARFEFRLSAFNPQATIGFSGEGTATDGERTEPLAADGDIDVDGRWRPAANSPSG